MLRERERGKKKEKEREETKKRKRERERGKKKRERERMLAAFLYKNLEAIGWLRCWGGNQIKLRSKIVVARQLAGDKIFRFSPFIKKTISTLLRAVFFALLTYTQLFIMPH